MSTFSMPQEIVELMNTPEERRAHTLETGFQAMALLYGPPPEHWRNWTGFAWDIGDEAVAAVKKCFNNYQIIFFSPQNLARRYAVWYTQEEQRCKNKNGSGSDVP